MRTAHDAHATPVVRTMAEKRHARGKIADDAARSLDAHVAHVVKRAPKLTPAQRDQLAVILKPFATESTSRKADAA
jgi:hypothetical protein